MTQQSRGKNQKEKICWKLHFLKFENGMGKRRALEFKPILRTCRHGLCHSHQFGWEEQRGILKWCQWPNKNMTWRNFQYYEKYLIRVPFCPVSFPLHRTALRRNSSTSLGDTSYTIHQLWEHHFLPHGIRYRRFCTSISEFLCRWKAMFSLKVLQSSWFLKSG